jgi:hypothetical protein
MVRAILCLAFSVGCLSLASCGSSSGKGDVPKDASPKSADSDVPQDGARAPFDTALAPDRAADGGRVPDVSEAKADGPPLSDTSPAKTDTPSAADVAPKVDGALPPDTTVLVDARPADTTTTKDTQPGRDVSDSNKPVTFATWPGGNAVANASVKNAFGTNLSGLIYQPAAGTAPAILWAVQNDPSKVFRMTWNGTAFVSVTSDGWSNGKTLTFPNGSGSPDSEALTRTEWDKDELYVATEKDSDAMSTVRLSILRYELTGTSTTLKATNEWNLTSDLPKATDANKGLEAIAWIPDSYLVARGFYDEASKAVYDPSAYANHGTGIFLVGVEDTGMIYGFALNHSTGAFKRVVTFSSGQEGVMDLAFDRETETLWSICDSVCKNRMTLFDIDTTEGTTKGRFILRATVPPPSTLTSTNNEGITMAPESECANGRKSFFWADDDESNGYAIRRDTIPCGRLF